MAYFEPIDCLVYCFIRHGCYFPEYLANIKFGKLPLPFWLGQQGAVLSFIVILVVYAITMDRMEEQLRQSETCEQVKLKVGA